MRRRGPETSRSWIFFMVSYNEPGCERQASISLRSVSARMRLRLLRSHPSPLARLATASTSFFMVMKKYGCICVRSHSRLSVVRPSSSMTVRRIFCNMRSSIASAFIVVPLVSSLDTDTLQLEV